MYSFKSDCHRIGLFSGRAARYPYPQVHSVFFEHIRQHVFLQICKGLGVPEKAGDPDEQILEQRRTFSVVPIRV
jgi:hypothetical protein